jgi:hypothetical protein
MEIFPLYSVSSEVLPTPCWSRRIITSLTNKYVLKQLITDRNRDCGLDFGLLVQDPPHCLCQFLLAEGLHEKIPDP